MPDTHDCIAEFEAHRNLLFAIAYRMVGTVSDAEDLVQEAYVRWQGSAGEVQAPKAFLTTVVTRLAIDHLKSARVRRETYIGPWLPEPLLTVQSPSADQNLALAESLSTAFLILLEHLTPVERAAFLLREIFDYDYDEIAAVLDKNEANCRQIVKRAKDHLQGRQRHLPVSRHAQEALLVEFRKACEQGDMEGLLAILSDDAILYSDGGGKIAAAVNPIYGADRVARFLLGITAKGGPGRVARVAEVNGAPGLIVERDGVLDSIISFELNGDKIQTIYGVRNPDKLKTVSKQATGEIAE